MNERSKEFVAKKKWDAWQVGLFTGVIIAMLVVMFILRTIWWMVAFLFVLVILSLYYMKNTFKAEYAYTLSNKLFVEILKSGGKRESLGEFFLSWMTCCGKYTKENKAKLTDVHETVVAATDVKDEDETYFALFEKDGKKTVLLFTPNEMMLSELKKVVSCSVE